MKSIALLFLLIIGIYVACGKDDDDSGSDTPERQRKNGDDPDIADVECLDKSFGSGVPDWISENFDCVQVTKSGSNYIFNTNDIPNHNSAYFGSDDDRYEAVPNGNKQNPNLIAQQSYKMTLPASPAVAADATDTAMDAIGIATNGVVFYNNEAAPGDSLSAEIESFDTYAGHPTQTGSYHYHVEPTFLTEDDDNLIGILLDGFPVFGRKCPATNAHPTDLDDNNGHTADTKIDGLDTIYHYHVADLTGGADDGVDVPVITGSYAGTPGSFTND